MVFVSVKPMFTKYLFNLPIIKICFIVILQRKKRREVPEKGVKCILHNFFEWALAHLQPHSIFQFKIEFKVKMLQ